MERAESPLKNLAQLKDLRKNVKDYAKRLITEGNEQKTSKITKHNPHLFSEGLGCRPYF